MWDPEGIPLRSGSGAGRPQPDAPDGESERGQSRADQPLTRRIESEMDAGSWRDRSEGGRTTLCEALVRYRREITPVKVSHETEESRIRTLSRSTLGNQTLSRISGREVADNIREREAGGASANTGSDSTSTSCPTSTTWHEAPGAWSISSTRCCSRSSPGQRFRKAGSGGSCRERKSGCSKRPPRSWDPSSVGRLRPRCGRVRLRGCGGNMWTGHGGWYFCPGPKTGRRGACRSPRPHWRSWTPCREGSMDRFFGLLGNAIRLGWKRAVAKARITGVLRFHDLRHEAISRPLIVSALSDMTHPSPNHRHSCMPLQLPPYSSPVSRALRSFLRATWSGSENGPLDTVLRYRV